MSEKVDTFYELLCATYNYTWPDELSLEASKTMWSEKIEKHTEEELMNAIRNTQRMMIAGHEQWQFMKIGQVLSLARNRSTAAHNMLLSGRDETKEEREVRRGTARQNIGKLKELFN